MGAVANRVCVVPAAVASYVALQTLCNVVHDDTSAVQRHKGTIVDCLKDPDVSIRKRALVLVNALVNEENVRYLAGELLNYLVRPPRCCSLCECHHRAVGVLRRAHAVIVSLVCRVVRSLGCICWCGHLIGYISLQSVREHQFVCAVLCLLCRAGGCR